MHSNTKFLAVLLQFKERNVTYTVLEAPVNQPTSTLSLTNALFL